MGGCRGKSLDQEKPKNVFIERKYDLRCQRVIQRKQCRQESKSEGINDEYGNRRNYRKITAGKRRIKNKFRRKKMEEDKGKVE